MAVARCAEDFSNADLMTKLSQGIDNLSNGVIPVRTCSDKDAHRVLFFAAQIQERFAEAGVTFVDSAEEEKMATLVDTFEGMTPAARTNDVLVASAVQTAGVFKL